MVQLALHHHHHPQLFISSVQERMENENCMQIPNVEKVISCCFLLCFFLLLFSTIPKIADDVNTCTGINELKIEKKFFVDCHKKRHTIREHDKVYCEYWHILVEVKKF